MFISNNFYHSEIHTCNAIVAITRLSPIFGHPMGPNILQKFGKIRHSFCPSIFVGINGWIKPNEAGMVVPEQIHFHVPNVQGGCQKPMLLLHKANLQGLQEKYLHYSKYKAKTKTKQLIKL
jgi:hypothetical protein